MKGCTDILAILEESGALKRGHFLLSSGLHSDRYCQCAALFERPDLASKVAALMAAALPDEIDVTVVLAPALGGVLWGYELARALASRRGQPIRSLFAERSAGGPFELRRGFSLAQGDKVLLAEDVVTTGGSVSELVPLVHNSGAAVAAFAVIADRSRGRFASADGRPFFALTQLEFAAWDPSVCPLCARGAAIDKPGSRVRAAEGSRAR